MDAIKELSFEHKQFNKEKCCKCDKNIPFSHCFIKFKYNTNCNDSSCLMYDTYSYMYCNITNKLLYFNIFTQYWTVSSHNSCKDNFIKINYSNFINNELYLLFYKLKLIELHLMSDIIVHIMLYIYTNLP